MGFPAIIAGGMAGLGAFEKIQAGNTAAQGAYMQGQATSASDLFQAAIAQQDAQVAEQNARWVMDAGEMNAYNVGQQTRQAKGTLMANQAASGVDVNSKSFVQARQTVENAGLQNEQNVIQEAAQKNYGYRVQAASDRAQAIMDTLGAYNAQAGARVNANASLLSGYTGAAGGLASAYPNFANVDFGGLFGSSQPSELSPGYELNY